MIQDDFLYSWIKFDFFDITNSTISRTRLVAMSDSSNSIVIWNYNEDNQTGALVAIIVDQFTSIEQLRWVHNTDVLLVKHEQTCTLWDPYENISIMSINCQEPIIFAKEFDEGYLIVLQTGSIEVFGKGYNKKIPSNRGFIWFRENSIVVYPFEYSFEDSELVHFNLDMERDDKRARRLFRSENAIDNNCKVFIKSDIEEFSSFEIPESYLFRFEQARYINIEVFTNFIIFSTDSFSLLKGGQDKSPSFLPIQYQRAIYVEDNVDYIWRLTGLDESRISMKNSQLLVEPLVDALADNKITFENIPFYFNADMDPDMKHTLGDMDLGFLWIPQTESSHLFLDLFQGTEIVFPETHFKSNLHLFIEPDGQTIFEWLPGKRYPEGLLSQRSIDMEDRNPIILYDVSNLPPSKSSDFESSSIPTDVESDASSEDPFPLIIPAWTKVILDLEYSDLKRRVILSRSELFLVLDSWSQLQNPVALLYPDNEITSKSYLKYGDLDLVHNEQTYRFMGIAPVWDYNQELNLLVTISIDGSAYVWLLDQITALPIASLSLNFPHSIKISPDGKFIAAVALTVNQQRFSGRSKSKDGNGKDTVQAEFPIAQLIVFDLATNKKHQRRYRLPTHLTRVNSSIQISFSGSECTFEFPSYIDINEKVICTYQDDNTKFSIKTESPHKRYWRTHSKNSPFDQLEKGNEFPVHPHPEIRREYALRPSMLLDQTLIRKSDQMIIASIENGSSTVDQVSTSKLYSLRETVQWDFPFKSKMRPIFISASKATRESGKSLLEIARLDSFPRFIKYQLKYGSKDIFLLRRLKEFIKRIIDEQCLHNEQGIAYHAAKIDIFKSLLEVQLEAINSAIYAQTKE
ncbi:MAG: hypothetical protein ACW98K_04500 [Candidatus Kariarchaeaceae archaeon]